MKHLEDHVPVLFEELIDSVVVFDNKQNIIVDGTLGLGGHALGVISKMHAGDIFIGIDTDKNNLKKARQHIESFLETHHAPVTCYFVHSNFSDIRKQIWELGIPKITAAYFDLGISSVHVDDFSRGFSFRADAPLDMRLNTEQAKTALDVIARYSYEDLLRIFREYGEDPKAYHIARQIIETRKAQPIETTAQLVALIKEASFDPKSKTRIFQAIRMEVNNELDSIVLGLEDTIALLESEGTISVITFHSVEDRVVKKVFQKHMKYEADPVTGQPIVPAQIQKVTKKPILPTQEEVERNPRSRSAKLRIVKKVV